MKIVAEFDCKHCKKDVLVSLTGDNIENRYSTFCEEVDFDGTYIVVDCPICNKKLEFDTIYLEE